MTHIRLVLGFVGTALLVTIVGIIVLALKGIPVPDVLQNIGVGALAGLIGLLVPTGRGSSQP